MAEETGNETQVVVANEVVDPSNEIVDPSNEVVHDDELVQADELTQGEELTHGEELLEGHEMVVAEVTTPKTARRRRKKSLVWEHFTIEDAPGGATRACCKLCKQTFAYSSGSKIAGTSHLKRHITLGSCPKIKNQEHKLALVSAAGTDNDGEGTVERRAKRRYRYTGYANASFDQDRSCSYLAKMIILHDYPLHIVQQPAFTVFIDSLQPRFRVVDVDAMEGEVYAVYQKEKESLLQALSSMPGRISLTTQWNTTYLMLLAALDYKQAFTTLETCDDNYNEAPSAEDWKKVEAACNYLKLLYDSAHSIMAAANPTSNIFFHEAWKLQLELANSIGHEDPVFSGIAKDMHERFDKYWKDCNLVLAVAVVMDPRFKMKLVEFSYSKIYGIEAAKYVKVVNDSVHELYKDYVAQPLPLTPAYVEQGETTNNAAANGNNPRATQPSTGDGLLDFDMYLSEIATSQPSKSELEQYLDESLTPRIQEFDILNWWKLNTLKFPTLSKMARDILAIPMSMVTIGSSIFSAGTGSHMLDDYRSSLRPEIVEALVCTKDWLQYTTTASETPSSAIVKAE